MFKFKKTTLALMLASTVLAGCFSSDDDNSATQTGTRGNTLAVTSDGLLISFDRENPSVSKTRLPLTGQSTAETVIGMDFRPRDSRFYVVTRDSNSQGRVYTLDPNTAVLTLVASLVANPTDTTEPYAGLSGTSFGVDFNPAADALRIISNTGQNLRMFVASNGTDRTAGQVFTDTPLTRTGSTAAFTDTATAYTNTFDGTTSTRQFSIDSTSGSLIQQSNPNGGITVTAAPLFATSSPVTSSNGFDIDGRNNVGYAILNVGGSTGFYTVAIPDSTATLPQTTPAATLVGAAPASNIVGLVIDQPAAPTVVALDGAAAGSQRLLNFGLRNSNAATAVSISGLSAGESLLSLDYRPANAKIYGLSSQGRVFTIDNTTGAATAVSTLSVAPQIVAGLAAGKSYSVDINPAADALRIVSSSQGGSSENYRVPGANLETTGATTTDTPLAFAAPEPTPNTFSVVSVVYTNSFANPRPTATRMFDIDATNSRLLQQTNPNGGTLAVIGGLGATYSGFGGIDVSGGDNGARLIALRTGISGAYGLFNLDLATGAASAAAMASGTNEIGTGTNAGTSLRAVTVKF